jgi:Mrp family chromosome partitioning ATPase
MSLIEAALQKAKELAATATFRAEKLPSGVVTPAPRKVRPALDAETLAARAAQAFVIPVASVDAQTMERHGVALEVSDKAADRAYRILRTRVEQRMQLEKWNSVAITAAGSGEGKTLTAINLAISLSRDVNTWVYLVDLDLQWPRVASYFGMQFGKGLGDYLAGNAEFGDIVYSPGIERLGVIPNAERMESASDILGSHRIQELCRSLAAEMPRHIVIFDLPPLLMGDDLLKFAPHVDCMLLVVSEGKTQRRSLMRAKEILQDMKLLGVVLNRTTEQQESGYY